MSERDNLLPTVITTTDSNIGPNTSIPDSKYSQFQKWLALFLESSKLHKIILTLVTIDGSCVLADLAYSFLSPTCSPPGEEGSPAWLLVLSHISLAITTFFLAEIPLSLWAFGLQFINPFGRVTHATLHAFDALIIITTFVLEIILRGKERELAGLLVILRLWRLVKLVGGVAVGAGEIQEETAEELAETRAELSESKVRLQELQQEIFLLKQRLSQFIQDI